jgi:hyperosmotically inducible protein
MKSNFLGRLLMTATLLAGAGLAGAADNHQAGAIQPDAVVADSVRHAVVMYPRYSIFDDAYIQVNEGTVHLTGVVSQPYKKGDLDKIIRQVAGAKLVQNDLRVLPLSPNDDRLRLRIARSIYGDATMTKYAIQPLKPIHIIVENGHVTLTGIVASNFDKQIAGTRAAGSMSFGPVINKLQVENPPNKS